MNNSSSIPQKKTTSTDLSAFQTISEFVTSIHGYYVDNPSYAFIHPLKLYYRLISKTTFVEETSILRHIQVFRHFCVSNREQVRNKSVSFNPSRIEFTDRIYLDMTSVFQHADAETVQTLWEYLMTLSALLDPDNKTKELLQQLKSKNGKEGEFIGNVLETMCKSIQPSDATNPMSMIGNIMSSNVFGTLMNTMNSNVENGQMDIGKLMGSMMHLIENVKEEVEKSDDPTIKQMMNMVNQIGKVVQVPDTNAIESNES